jgi:hypothetical protein
MNETNQMPVRLSRLFWVGTILLIAGTAPLLVIVAMAALGLTKDPNPNPIGFELLAGITVWPSLGLIALGLRRSRLLKTREGERHKVEGL